MLNLQVHCNALLMDPSLQYWMQAREQWCFNVGICLMPFNSEHQESSDAAVSFGSDLVLPLQ